MASSDYFDEEESGGEGKSLSQSEEEEEDELSPSSDKASDIRLKFTINPTTLDAGGRPLNKMARKSSRNENEKMRRDRLNAYIGELAQLVPLVLSSSKKLDKSSVLRLTVAYLRVYHDLIKNGNGKVKWKPDFLSYDNLGNMLLESLGGFLLVIHKVEDTMKLIFATDAITESLGHNLVDVLGYPIDSLIHTDDLMMLYQLFEYDSSTTGSVDQSPTSLHRSCYVRMSKLSNNCKSKQCYDLVHIVGHLKVVPSMIVSGNGLYTDSNQQGSSNVFDVCLVAVGKTMDQEPIKELYPLPDIATNQWITRHEMDGKITFSDQRGAWLTGFMPGESIGMSAYSLLHPEDIGAVVAMHNMFLTSADIPKTVFRMFTKSRDVLYIQTSTHMIIDMWSSKPKFIISINEVLELQDGKKRLDDQRRRVQAITDATANLSLGSSPQECSTADLSLSDSTDLSSLTASGESMSLRSSSCTESVNSPSLSVYESSIGTNRSSSTPRSMIAEVEEVDDQTVHIVVGDEKYPIDLGRQEKLQSQHHKPSSDKTIFDPNVHNDDGGDSISWVKPKFLGDDVPQEEGNRNKTFSKLNDQLGNGHIPVPQTRIDEMTTVIQQNVASFSSPSSMNNLDSSENVNDLVLRYNTLIEKKQGSVKEMLNLLSKLRCHSDLKKTLATGVEDSAISQISQLPITSTSQSTSSGGAPRNQSSADKQLLQLLTSSPLTPNLTDQSIVNSEVSHFSADSSFISPSPTSTATASDSSAASPSTYEGSSSMLLKLLSRPTDDKRMTDSSPADLGITLNGHEQLVKTGLPPLSSADSPQTDLPMGSVPQDIHLHMQRIKDLEAQYRNMQSGIDKLRQEYSKHLQLIKNCHNQPPAGIGNAESPSLSASSLSGSWASNSPGVSAQDNSMDIDAIPSLPAPGHNNMEQNGCQNHESTDQSCTTMYSQLLATIQTESLGVQTTTANTSQLDKGVRVSNSHSSWPSPIGLTTDSNTILPVNPPHYAQNGVQLTASTLDTLQRIGGLNHNFTAQNNQDPRVFQKNQTDPVIENVSLTLVQALNCPNNTVHPTHTPRETTMPPAVPTHDVAILEGNVNRADTTHLRKLLGVGNSCENGKSTTTKIQWITSSETQDVQEAAHKLPNSSLTKNRLSNGIVSALKSDSHVIDDILLKAVQPQNT